MRYILIALAIISFFPSSASAADNTCSDCEKTFFPFDIHITETMTSDTIRKYECITNRPNRYVCSQINRFPSTAKFVLVEVDIFNRIIHTGTIFDCSRNDYQNMLKQYKKVFANNDITKTRKGEYIFSYLNANLLFDRDDDDGTCRLSVWLDPSE